MVHGYSCQLDEGEDAGGAQVIMVVIGVSCRDTIA